MPDKSETFDDRGQLAATMAAGWQYFNSTDVCPKTAECRNAAYFAFLSEIAFVVLHFILKPGCAIHGAMNDNGNENGNGNGQIAAPAVARGCIVGTGLWPPGEPYFREIPLAPDPAHRRTHSHRRGQCIRRF